jgi:hypothetical protein
MEILKGTLELTEIYGIIKPRRVVTLQRISGLNDSDPIAHTLS